MIQNSLKLFCLIFTLSVALSSAQQKSNFLQNLPEPINGIIKCASDEYNAQMLERYPNMMGSEAFERELQEKIDELSIDNDRRVVMRLPVVVHVIHNGEPVGSGTNISDAQVLSQIQVINEDYRKMVGTNGFNTDPNGADTELEFFLAQEDPNCNPTNGINRVRRSSLPNSGASVDGDIKPATIWDSSRYINMWTVNLGGGLLGYATFPGGDPLTDGVVMGYQFFGSNDAPGVNIGGDYNLGRTTTHELGHYFGLFHTFQGGCNGAGDAVDDTPAQGQPNYGCNLSNIPDTCPTQPGDDPIENYMDYSDDICMNIFTNGQNTRIQAVLAGPRASLVASDVPENPLPDVTYDASILIANFEDTCGAKTPQIQLTNYGTANLTSVTIFYNIDGGTSNSVNWTGNLAQEESTIVELPEITSPVGTNILNVSVSQPNADERICNDLASGDFDIVEPADVNATNVFFSLTTDTYSNETEWEFTDSSGAILASGGPYDGTSDDSSTFTATIPLNNSECYNFTITDTFGDGICCNYGNGNYEIREDDENGNIITQGAAFGAIDTFSFVAETLSTEDYFVNNSIYLFPNPTKDILNIKMARSNELPDSFQIVNMLGQSVMNLEINASSDLEINTSALSNGVYFLRLNKDQSSKVLQFIKN